MNPALFDELVLDLNIERTMGMSMEVHAQIPLCITVQAGTYNREFYRGRIEFMMDGYLRWTTLENTFTDSKFFPNDAHEDSPAPSTFDLTDDQGAAIAEMFGCQLDFPPEVSWQLYCLHQSSDIVQWLQVFEHVLLFPRYASVPMDDIREALSLVYDNLLNRFASGRIYRSTPAEFWQMLREHLHLD